jgi:hypothetical protein
MIGEPISVGGITIPSNTPFFLTLISIHVLAALICVVAGIVAMLSEKKQGYHPKAGSVYFYSLLVVFLTVVVISILRWQEDYYLFLLGLLSFGMAFTGRRALKQKWRRWPIYHITGMGLSYIILLTAFYVDNGRFLPIWKYFSPVVYWTLPAIIGIPIIVINLMRHQVVKTYKML